MEKKRLRIITIFSLKKNRNSQITNKNEINETEEKKGNATVSLLRCIKKYTVLI